MPMLRSRGGTRTPSAGDDTTCPPMLIVPAVGCSRPATQRRVVVLPQPEGPSSTTISPAGTAKLTPPTAAMPAKSFLRSLTSSAADIASVLLAVAVGLVPVLDPLVAQSLVLLEVRHPDLDDLGIPTLRGDRRPL